MNASNLTKYFLLLLANALSACATLLGGPETKDAAARLKHFPTENLSLRGRTVISWDKHGVPFIEAEKDEDVPFALGLVHAHLRMNQLELMRYISSGRVSELAGPWTRDIDHTLRILNFGKAKKEIIAQMPKETKAWAERFLLGINTYIDRNPDLIPPDLKALGVSSVPHWTLEELVTAWRLAAVDVNWFVYINYLQTDEKYRNDLWKILLEEGQHSTPTFTDAHSFANSIFGFSDLGSNSVVLGKTKSRSNSSLIMSDPHLGLTIPNLWLLAGFKSPSYQVVGMMPPGIPFVALGRNPTLAWGGTNMWGLSTFLYEVPDAETASLAQRTETIRTRNWFSREVTVRESKYGPIISDSPLFRGTGKTLALKWVGHEPSDELTAFLKANRARNVDEFHKAFATYGVSAMNMLACDHEGGLTHVLAYAYPERPNPSDRSPIQPAKNSWSSVRKPTQLPFHKNPKEDFIASANNRPFSGAPEVGWFFQSSDRVDRLKELVGKSKNIEIDDLKRMQLDTFSPTGFKLKQLLVDRVQKFNLSEIQTNPGWIEFTRWDGQYTADSKGASAFETLMSDLAPRLLKAKFQSEVLAEKFLRNSAWKNQTLQYLQTAPNEDVASILKESFKAISGSLAQVKPWQEKHFVRAAHPLVNLPVIGSRWSLTQFGHGGGSDTVFKTASSMSKDSSTAYYGTNARHVSDLADLDANFFVLFGGQDGWFVSPNTIDQVELWRKGEYIQLPLSESGRKSVFTVSMVLSPGETKGNP